MSVFYRTVSWPSVPSAFLVFFMGIFGIAGLWANQNVNSEHRWYHGERSSQWWACQDARGFLVRKLPNGEVRSHPSQTQTGDRITWQHIEHLYRLKPPPYENTTSPDDCRVPRPQSVPEDSLGTLLQHFTHFGEPREFAQCCTIG